jgi:hypothetical protein
MNPADLLAAAQAAGIKLWRTGRTGVTWEYPLSRDHSEIMRLVGILRTYDHLLELRALLPPKLPTLRPGARLEPEVEAALTREEPQR